MNPTIVLANCRRAWWRVEKRDPQIARLGSRLAAQLQVQLCNMHAHHGYRTWEFVGSTFVPWTGNACRNRTPPLILLTVPSQEMFKNTL